MRKTSLPPVELLYPKTAYAVLFFIYEAQSAQMLFPLQNIYTSLDDIVTDIENCASEIAQFEDKAAGVHEHALLLPLTFEKHYPLKKMYWENPTESYTIDNRMRAFLHTMGQNTMMRKMLVTPNPFDKKQKPPTFAAALPYFERDEHMIEYFMQKSDWPVEIQAKDAAIYTMGELVTFNWQTKTFEEHEIDTDTLIN